MRLLSKKAEGMEKGRKERAGKDSKGKGKGKGLCHGVRGRPSGFHASEDHEWDFSLVDLPWKHLFFSLYFHCQRNHVDSETCLNHAPLPFAVELEG